MSLLRLLCCVALLAVIPAGPCGAAPLEGSPFASPATTSLAAAIRSTSADAHRVALLSGGYEALLVRLHLIRSATSSIDIQTFIWSNDEVGRLMMYELITAARRGVSVRIIADHFASDQDPEAAAFLTTAHPNLEIKLHRPAGQRLKASLWANLVAGVTSFRGLNQRMHNKVMLFDGAVLITGGRNIENTYFDRSTEMNFRDRDVLVLGPAVGAAAASFAQYWDFKHCVPAAQLRDVAAEVARGAFRRYEQRHHYDLGPQFGATSPTDAEVAAAAARCHARLRLVAGARFVADEPGKLRDLLTRDTHVARELRTAVEQARESVIIQTPYLVLSRPARRLFRHLQNTQPGLTIRVSTNSFASTDNLMAYSGNYRLRNLYVEDLRLQIHEFKPQPASLPQLFPDYDMMAGLARPRLASGEQRRTPFLCIHSKSLVVDDRIAFVGSYNLDPRSESLNTEAGLLVDDEAFARELRAEIETDMLPGNSWVIARRPLPLRADVVNGWVADLLNLSPLDVWPIQNTSSYELREGSTPVPPGHPEFYRNYREIGPFPGADGRLTNKEIVTRLYKAVGKPLTPLL